MQQIGPYTLFREIEDWRTATAVVYQAWDGHRNVTVAIIDRSEITAYLPTSGHDPLQVEIEALSTKVGTFERAARLVLGSSLKDGRYMAVFEWLHAEEAATVVASTEMTMIAEPPDASEAPTMAVSAAPTFYGQMQNEGDGATVVASEDQMARAMAIPLVAPTIMVDTGQLVATRPPAIAAPPPAPNTKTVVLQPKASRKPEETIPVSRYRTGLAIAGLIGALGGTTVGLLIGLLLR